MGKTEKISIRGVYARDLPDRKGDDFKVRLQQSAEAKRKLLQVTKEASKQAKGDLSMKALHEAFSAPKAQDGHK